jgi:hypothetical protein
LTREDAVRVCRLAQEDFAVFAARAAPAYVQDAERISDASDISLLLVKAGTRIDERDRAAILKHVNEHCAATTTKEKTQPAQWSQSSPEGWAERLRPLFAHQATSPTLSRALWETFCAHPPLFLGGSKLEEPVQCHVSIIAALLRHHLNVGNHHPHFVFDTHSSAAALQTGDRSGRLPRPYVHCLRDAVDGQHAWPRRVQEGGQQSMAAGEKKKKKRENEARKKEKKVRRNAATLVVLLSRVFFSFPFF